MKIAIIGGGSTYTPELFDGLIDKAQALGLSSVVLQDNDAARQEVVASFCRRMADSRGADFHVSATTQRQEALKEADFVIIQIRVGGQEARNKDIRVALKHGLIGQETTGVGGFAKALRTLPQVLEVCSDVVRFCPDAWVLNFTNPSGLITEGIIRATGVQTIGLCNIPVTAKKELARILGAEQEEMDLDYVGLNHLSWIRKVMVKGVDRLKDVFDTIDNMDHVPDELDYPREFLDSLGAIPSGYLRYYYQTRKMLRELEARQKTRAEEVMEIEKEIFDALADPNATEKPEALSKRGGSGYSEAALGLIDALANNKREIHIVNVQNGNSIPGLPPDCVVEIPCLVNAYGAHPLDAGDVEPQFLSLMQHVKAYEQLTIQAVLEGSRKKALLALVTHPLGPAADKAGRILDDILDYVDIRLS